MDNNASSRGSGTEAPLGGLDSRTNAGVKRSGAESLNAGEISSQNQSSSELTGRAAAATGITTASFTSETDFFFGTGSGSVICTVIRCPAEDLGGFTRLKEKSLNPGASARTSTIRPDRTATPPARAMHLANWRIFFSPVLCLLLLREVSQNWANRASLASGCVTFSHRLQTVAVGHLGSESYIIY